MENFKSKNERPVGNEETLMSENIKVAEEELSTHFDTYKSIQDSWGENRDFAREKWDAIIEKHEQAYETAVENINAITLAAGGMSLYGSICAFAYAAGNTGFDSSSVRDGLAYGSAGFLLAVAIGVLGLGSRGIAEGMKKFNAWNDERREDKEITRIDSDSDKQKDEYYTEEAALADTLDKMRLNS